MSNSTITCISCGDTYIKKSRIITEGRLKKYRKILQEQEKSKHTIEKYIHDVRMLQEYAAGKPLTKKMLINYKDHMETSGHYMASSINSYIAAINSFCDAMKWDELHIKMLRTQKSTFTSEQNELTKPEYERLIRTAIEQDNERLALVIETLGSAGIRISELPYVTVESLKSGTTIINNKGKIRQILYPKKLVNVLLEYCKKHKIISGYVFRTYRGNPIDRSNLWRSMKRLCESADVDPCKVYPHNMRHLFARCFYEQKADISKLADVLGHSSIETTRIYIKTSGKEHKKQLDKMGMVI